MKGRMSPGICALETTGARASKTCGLSLRCVNALLKRQRLFARGDGLVADGRDMGTVVFPAADLKIYLTASIEERAKAAPQRVDRKGRRC